jgi:hypothetical protein
VVVTRFECSKILLEAGILIDGFAANRRWEVGIAGTAHERHLQIGLAHLVKTHLNRKGEVAVVARNEVTEAETETRRSFAEVNAS